MATKTTKKTPAYKIGQIVYILSNKSQSIIPALIVERMLVEKMEGNTVSWKLAMGAKGNPNKPQKIEDSRNINGEIFASLDDIKAELQTKLAKFIEDITAQAKKRTEAWYGNDLKKRPKNPGKAPDNGKIDPEDILEDLDGSGTVNSGIAHVQTPTQDQSNLSADAQKADVQARLKEMATMTDEEMAEEDGEQNQEGEPAGYITGPGGERIPVNLKA